MTLAQGVIVYFVTWWLLLFMALPIGVEMEDKPLEGQNRSSPKKAYIAIKCAWVTGLALLVTYAIDLFLRSGIVSVH